MLWKAIQIFFIYWALQIVVQICHSHTGSIFEMISWNSCWTKLE
jgi:hypothetical protein